MGITIPIQFYKGQETKKKDKYDTSPWTPHIIAAPENMPELAGYILKTLPDNITVKCDSITIHEGNEWSKKEKQYLYMFEKEIKVPRHPSKRHRYTEDEMIRMYGSAISPTFEKRLKKRENLLSSGPGSLIKAKYTAYNEREGKESTEGWFVAPEADKIWVYPINYEPLRDQGKHNRNAKGFEVLEEYGVPDIAVLRNNTRLIQLLAELDHIRGLSLKINEYAWIFPKRGKTITPSSFLESIAFSTYNAIPEEIRYEKISGKRLPGSPDWRETPEGERIRQELTELSTELEEKCQDIVRQYKIDKITTIASEISDLVGINIQMLI